MGEAPFYFSHFLSLVIFFFSLCADFKSYPKTIPTEIIYYRLGLTTQWNESIVCCRGTVQFTLHIFTRQTIYSMPFAFPSSFVCRHVFLSTLSTHTKNINRFFMDFCFGLGSDRVSRRTHCVSLELVSTYVIDVVFLEFGANLNADYACRSFYHICSQLFVSIAFNHSFPITCICNFWFIYCSQFTITTIFDDDASSIDGDSCGGDSHKKKQYF